MQDFHIYMVLPSIKFQLLNYIKFKADDELHKLPLTERFPTSKRIDFVQTVHTQRQRKWMDRCIEVVFFFVFPFVIIKM